MPGDASRQDVALLFLCCAFFKTPYRYDGSLSGRNDVTDRDFSWVPGQHVPPSGAATSLTRSPIGLDISARTPEEIAISIMAEILMFRLGGKGGVMKLEERLIQSAVKRAAKPEKEAELVSAD